MTTHITKTWFEDGKLITQLFEEKDIYKREWVWLTDEEIKKIAKKHKWHEQNVAPHLMPVYRSLEAKLKQKNGFAEEKNT